MALNSFDARIVTRGGRRSQNVIARAAYNGRTKLFDERTKELKDYTHRDGLEWEHIFIPEGAPAWMADRQKLWNEVERREDRSTKPDTAQLARSWIIALPHELTADERRNLISDFAEDISRSGIVVDVALHEPDKGGNSRNYHAHLLLTMRQIEDGSFGNKMRHLNKVAQLAVWKDRWSEIGALHLERAGFEIEAERFRQGHLSLQQQRYFAELRGDHEFAKSLDREPNIHLGPDVLAMERKGQRTEKGDEYCAIEQRNQEREKDRELARTKEAIQRKPERQTPLTRAINDAWEVSDTAHQFVRELHERGLHIAVVKPEDVVKEIDVNHVAGWHAPNEKQIGDFVVLTNWGRVYPLNERTTGMTPQLCQEFMSTLKSDKFQGISAKTRELGDERNKGSLHLGRKGGIDTDITSRVIEKAPLRVMAAAFDSVSDAFESLFSSPASPEQQNHAAELQRLRQEQRERDEAERER